MVTFGQIYSACVFLAKELIAKCLANEYVLETVMKEQEGFPPRKSHRIYNTIMAGIIVSVMLYFPNQ